MSQPVSRELYCNKCGVQTLEFEPGLWMMQMDCPKCGMACKLGPELSEQEKTVVPETVVEPVSVTESPVSESISLMECTHDEPIRPEVQALIVRGRVHADEIPPGANLTEASALVPVLVNSALGLRINRVRAKYIVQFTEGEDPVLSPHALHVMSDEAARRIQCEPKQLWPNLKNADFANRILASVEAQGGRPEVARTYEQALLQLSHEAATRLLRRG